MVTFLDQNPPETVTYDEEYGWPWTVAVGLTFHNSTTRQLYPRCKMQLAGNITIGLLTVAVLTFASMYLVRAIVAGLRAAFGKPQLSKEEGPETPSKSL
jgi:hypothetical protein